MRWIDRLELKFGRFAIPGLIRIVVGFNALVFLLYKWNPRYLDALDLVPERIFQGEVWRLVTYLFIPQFGSVLLGDWLSILIYLWFLLFIGDGLEQAWGAFRLNLFYACGMVGTTVAALFFDQNFSSAMLNASLFFAFASFYGETVIHLFFVLPLKVKWLAWMQGAMIVIGLAVGSWSYRWAVLAAMGNYLLFFGPALLADARSQRDSARRRLKFRREHQAEPAALHTCAVCRCSEITNPEKEFRVARDGHEYCLEHLPSRSRNQMGGSRSPGT